MKKAVLRKRKKKSKSKKSFSEYDKIKLRSKTERFFKALENSYGNIKIIAKRFGTNNQQIYKPILSHHLYDRTGAFHKAFAQAAECRGL